MAESMFLDELHNELEKLIEICFGEFCMVASDSPCGCDGCPYGKYGSENDECFEAYKKDKLGKLEKSGVTVRKTGQWIDMGDFASCSVCRCTQLKEFESYYGAAKRVWIKTRYCPNCGAKMYESE